jgi:hypothetical protein
MTVSMPMRNYLIAVRIYVADSFVLAWIAVVFRFITMEQFGFCRSLCQLLVPAKKKVTRYLHITHISWEELHTVKANYFPVSETKMQITVDYLLYFPRFWILFYGIDRELYLGSSWPYDSWKELLQSITIVHTNFSLCRTLDLFGTLFTWCQLSLPRTI